MEKNKLKMICCEIAENTKVPLRVCMALGGDIGKINVLGKKIINPLLEEDSEALKKVIFNTDPTDSKKFFRYLSILPVKSSERVALKKLFLLISESDDVSNILDIDSMPQESIDELAKFFFATLRNNIEKRELQGAFRIIDPNHIKDLNRPEGKMFYISPGTAEHPVEKHVGELGALRVLGIDEVVIPYGVSVIKSFAFENSKIKRVQIPNTVSHIHNHAFFGCDLESVTIPNNQFLTSLGMSAFANNPRLHEVYLPASITELDMRVFENSPVKKIFSPVRLTLTHNNRTDIVIVPY